VSAVIARSYERIHRSNRIGMGVLPLEFVNGASAESLGLNGGETYDISGIADGMQAGSTLRVTATRGDGTEITFDARSRIDTEVEAQYYRHGGILHMVLRELLRA
jgi:aconitate hydratase